MVDAVNALVTALLRVDGLEISVIRSLLLTLCAANQACGGERLPGRLHLHIGLGAWNGPEPPLLRTLCVAAYSVLDALDDGVCTQMLCWITEAWRARANEVEQARRSAELGDDFAQGARQMVAPTPDAPVVPRQLAWRDEGIPWRDLAQAANTAGRVTKAEGRAPFFAVFDEAASDAGLGCVSNAPAMAHRNRLAAALMAGQAVDASLLECCLQGLELENKASCRESDPKRLYLYMGLGPVKRRARHRASRFLRRLSAAAQAAKPEQEDRSARQMLDWMAGAWQMHATLLERAAPRQHETSLASPESAAAQADAVDAANRAEAGASEELRRLLLQKRIGKTRVKHLARRVHAQAVTVGHGEAIEGDATPQQIRTMHKHLRKVIAHLSAAAHADHVALHSLRYVHARLQQALERTQ